MARKTHTTPKGTFVYPHLHAPDTKFDARGIYGLKLTIPAADAGALVEMLDAEHAAAQIIAKKENPKKKITEGVLPYDVDEDTGDVTVKFKMVANGKRKDGTEYTQRPKLFDAKGKPLPQGTKVGGGTVGRVGFEIMPYWTQLAGAGVSLRLQAAQIIELVAWGDRSASSFGFGEEDGFSAEDLDDSQVAGDAATTGSEDASTEFDTEQGEGDAAQDASDF